MNATIMTTDQARRYLQTAYGLINAYDGYDEDSSLDIIDADPNTCIDCGRLVAPWFEVCAECATGEPNRCGHALQTERGYCLDCGEVIR